MLIHRMRPPLKIVVTALTAANIVVIVSRYCITPGRTAKGMGKQVSRLVHAARFAKWKDRCRYRPDRENPMGFTNAMYKLR